MAEHGLSEDEVADLQEAFSMYDVDGGGTLHEVDAACSLFAPEWSTRTVSREHCARPSRPSSGFQGLVMVHPDPSFRWRAYIAPDVSIQ